MSAKDEVRREIAEIHALLKFYREDHGGELPNTDDVGFLLEQIPRIGGADETEEPTAYSDEESLTDPWGNRYGLHQRSGDKAKIVCSGGPDGEINEADYEAGYCL